MLGIIALATIAPTAVSPTTFGSGHFIENKGQWDSRARFLLKQPGVNYWVTDSGTVIDFHREQRELVEDAEGTRRSVRHRIGDVVSVNFVGASKAVRPIGVSKQEAVSNFITPTAEINGVASCAEARLVNVVPVVTARYYMDQGAPRYDVILHLHQR